LRGLTGSQAVHRARRFPTRSRIRTGLVTFIGRSRRFLFPGRSGERERRGADLPRPSQSRRHHNARQAQANSRSRSTGSRQVRGLNCPYGQTRIGEFGPSGLKTARCADEERLDRTSALPVGRRVCPLTGAEEYVESVFRGRASTSSSRSARPRRGRVVQWQADGGSCPPAGQVRESSRADRSGKGRRRMPAPRNLVVRTTPP